MLMVIYVGKLCVPVYLPVYLSKSTRYSPLEINVNIAGVLLALQTTLAVTRIHQSSFLFP